MGFAAHTQNPLAVNFRRGFAEYGDMGVGRRVAGPERRPRIDRGGGEEHARVPRDRTRIVTSGADIDSGGFRLHLRSMIHNYYFVDY